MMPPPGFQPGPYGGPPPNMMQHQQGAYPGQPGGYPQQMQMQQHPGGPPPPGQARHAGIGAVGQAPNLAPVNAPAPSPYGKIKQTGERFALFISSIADGLEDFWIERLLNVRALRDDWLESIF
jgi:hypothetical protein